MMSDQCISCKHICVGTPGCDAFPDQIPYEIVSGKFDHTQPHEGDHGIRYEPLDGKVLLEEP